MGQLHVRASEDPQWTLSNWDMCADLTGMLLCPGGTGLGLQAVLAVFKVFLLLDSCWQMLVPCGLWARFSLGLMKAVWKPLWSPSEMGCVFSCLLPWPTVF